MLASPWVRTNSNLIKITIDYWVCPDVLLNQDISLAKAKKAISDYKKAIGRLEGLAN